MNQRLIARFSYFTDRYLLLFFGIFALLHLVKAIAEAYGAFGKSESCIMSLSTGFNFIAVVGALYTMKTRPWTRYLVTTQEFWQVTMMSSLLWLCGLAMFSTHPSSRIYRPVELWTTYNLPFALLVFVICFAIAMKTMDSGRRWKNRPSCYRA